MFCLAILGAAAYTPGAKTSGPPATRAAVNMQTPKATPLRSARADAQQRSSLWFEVEEPPNEPNLSCYLDSTDKWMCAYDSDLKIVVDPEDSW